MTLKTKIQATENTEDTERQGIVPRMVDSTNIYSYQGLVLAMPKLVFSVNSVPSVANSFF